MLVSEVMVQFDVQECEQCPNVKLVEETVKLNFDIEPGMDTGYEISLSEEGEPHADGDSGDLNIVLVGDPHPVFHRNKNNLNIKRSISLLEALVGFETEIDHLDGHKVLCLINGEHRSATDWLLRT